VLAGARGGLVAALGAAAAAVAHVVHPHGPADDLALLAAALVVGELLVLRLEDRDAVPLSFAVLVVLAAAFDAGAYALTVLPALLVVHVVLPAAGGRLRVVRLVDRVAVAAATFAAYRAVVAFMPHDESVASVLASLAAAATAQVGADVAVRAVTGSPPRPSVRWRLAWLAVASSGILMAVGYRGVGGAGDIGLWGPLLFASPLLATWYAFDRLESATSAYRQTIEALAMAPEFGGLVAPGHAQRVGTLAVAVGREVGLAEADLADLERAALLHHLGQVTQDDPEVAGRPDPADVAAVTSAMLRDIRPLAAAGEIVGGDTDDEDRRVAAQILRIASAYDDLTSLDGTTSPVALETLRSAPPYVYDGALIEALARVVEDDRAPV
jgi:hypothetical protein